MVLVQPQTMDMGGRQECVCVCGHVYEEAVEVQNQNWWRL